MKPITLLTGLCVIAMAVYSGLLALDNSPPPHKKNKDSNKVSVERTKEEWKKILSPEQFRILREAGTERPNGKIYLEFKEQGAGTYYCAGCNTELFSSKEKFDSHCGWPSFYYPSKAKNIKTSTDYHLGYARTEVLCSSCGGHLGHVFKGEGFDTPTDKRYCINGTVLKFVPLTNIQSGKLSREKGEK